MDKSILNATVEKIEAELSRLGALGDSDSPYDFVVDADDDLPAGWVRVSDETASVWGPATEVLKRLEDQEELGWEAAWEALSGLKDTQPTSSHDWSDADALAKTTQIEEGTVNDNPYCVVELKTNAGPRFAWGPSGVSEDCVSSHFGSGVDLAESFEDAKDTAEGEMAQMAAEAAEAEVESD